MGRSNDDRKSLRRALVRGGSRLLGFGLSVILLAASSLLLIPMLITSGGQQAWGSIAVGQSIGVVAAVLIYFGWGHTGPAMVARANALDARREFADSIRTRAVLFLPVTVIACFVAAIVGPSDPWLAVAGCLSAAAIGFTSDWYFVGKRQPYSYLTLETLPRVLGTLTGVLVLAIGGPTVMGPLCALAGMLVAGVATSLWVLVRRRPGIEAIGKMRPIRQVLRSQRHGVASGVGTAMYSAAPLVLVSLVAPGVQPTYALVDKLQRQLSVALGPVVSVVQGYVPTSNAWRTATRAKLALAVSAVFCATLIAAVLVVAPGLLGWLGAGQVQPPYFALVLMSVFVGLNVWESVLARAVLAAFEALPAVARGTMLSAVVGLPLVIAGAIFLGVTGALLGLVVGLAARTLFEFVVAVTHIRAVHGTAEEGNLL